jgi:hypothetical protein
MLSREPQASAGLTRSPEFLSGTSTAKNYKVNKAGYPMSAIPGQNRTSLISIYSAGKKGLMTHAIIGPITSVAASSASLRRSAHPGFT